MRVKLESPLGKGNGRPVFRVVNNVHQVGLLSSRTLRVSKFWVYQGKQGIARASMVSTVLTENNQIIVLFNHEGIHYPCHSLVHTARYTSQ